MQGITDNGKHSRIVLAMTEVGIVQSGQRQALANGLGNDQEFMTVTVSILLQKWSFPSQLLGCGK